MNRMIGRTGWVSLAAIVMQVMVSPANGGNLDSPGAPTDPASAMFTIEDVYSVLNTHTTNVSKRTSFSEPAAGPTTGTMHTLNDLMNLATSRVSLAKTGQVNVYFPGVDDGARQGGVAWPNPRFTPVAASGEATNQIRDNLTGLIWARNANLASNTTWAAGWSSVGGTCTWDRAFDVITNSNGPVNGAYGNLGNGYGGTNDWRLPNRHEMDTLINVAYSSPGAYLSAQGFVNVRVDSAYHTSTIAYIALINNGRYTPWAAAMGSGNMAYNSSAGVTYYVWPVRGGQ